MEDGAPYVLSWDVRNTFDGEFDDDWCILYCESGDTYQAFYERGPGGAPAWWLIASPGDPSVGPLESVDACVEWLNVGEY